MRKIKTEAVLVLTKSNYKRTLAHLNSEVEKYFAEKKASAGIIKFRKISNTQFVIDEHEPLNIY